MIYIYTFFGSQELGYLVHDNLQYNTNKFQYLRRFWQFLQKRCWNIEFISNIKISEVMYCPVSVLSTII